MSQVAEDREMDDIASVGSVQGPQELVPKRTPMTGHSPTLMHPRCVAASVIFSLWNPDRSGEHKR